MPRPPPRPPLSPSPPLSRPPTDAHAPGRRDRRVPPQESCSRPCRTKCCPPPSWGFPLHGARGRRTVSERSEEHTSELQSRLHLVCRLLLEKKKNNCTAHESI